MRFVFDAESLHRITDLRLCVPGSILLFSNFNLSLKLFGPDFVQK